MQELFIRIGQAYLLGNIINYFGEDHNNNNDSNVNNNITHTGAIWSAIGFVACAGVGATMNHFNITLTDHIGIQMKTATLTLIYKKVLLVIIVD